MEQGLAVTNGSAEIQREKPIRTKIIKFTTVVIVSAVITFTTLVVQGYLHTLSEMWEEYQIPYDIEDDYIISTQIMRARVFLLSNGFDEDGFILTKLKDWQKNRYERALSKVPEDDGVRTALWYYYELLPFLANIDNDTFSTSIPKLIEALEKVINLRSKSKYIELEGRYLMSSHIISFFNGGVMLRKEDDKWLPQIIKYTTLLTQNNPQLESLVKYRDLNAEPLILMVDGFLLNLELMFKKYHTAPKTFSCESEEVKSIVLYMDAVPELHLKYYIQKPKLKMTYENNYLSYMKVFEDNFSEAREFLQNKCNIKVKYDNFPIAN